MLALKNVLTAGEDVGMLIFDEIDTGVSGHAAQQIGRKLSAIARKKQTLCVTHLPQIAAMGDHHLRISKSVRDGRSFTGRQSDGSRTPRKTKLHGCCPVRKSRTPRAQKCRGPARWGRAGGIAMVFIDERHKERAP